MEASFTVYVYPGELFTGTVRQIRNCPQTVQNVVTYDAVVAAIVPASYAQPDRRGVWVQGGADPQLIGLRIGLSDGNRTEMIEGALWKATD